MAISSFLFEFVKKAVAESLSANKTLSLFRLAGGEIRTQTFFDIFRNVIGAAKLPNPLRFVGLDKIPNPAKFWVSELTEHKFNFKFTLTGTNVLTGEEKTEVFWVGRDSVPTRRELEEIAYENSQEYTDKLEFKEITNVELGDAYRRQDVEI